MKIYISIPMTGKDMEAQRKIAGMWQRYFESQKCEVVNPFILSEELNARFKKVLDRMPDYDDYLQNDLKHIPYCTHMFLCHGWEKSNGCLCEVETAMRHNIRYLFERDFKYC